MDLVAFICPSCNATVYISPNAECGHMCKKTKPRARFVKFKRTVDR